MRSGTRQQNVYDETESAFECAGDTSRRGQAPRGEQENVTRAEDGNNAKMTTGEQTSVTPGDPGAPADRVNLGASIRTLRKRVGITQEGLAERLGVHTTFIGRLERGERGAHWRTVRRVLRALELTPADFSATLEEIELQQRDR